MGTVFKITSLRDTGTFVNSKFVDGLIILAESNTFTHASGLLLLS